jgi:DNA-binding transcriptional ArsR family regulator
VEPVRQPIPYEELSLYLRLLGVPNRLQLLRRLQLPHAAADIHLGAARRAQGRDPARSISRNAIEMHLRRLEDAGLVRGRDATRDGRVVREYTTNHARLFTVIEELRRVALIRASRSDATEAAAEGDGVVQPPTLPPGPALLLVNGPLEGLAFALDGEGPWRIGRQSGVEVVIPHDPFVSRESARIETRGDGFDVLSLAGSRNPPKVNWTALAPGERRALVPGDTLGVGKSLLVFRRPGGSRP